MDADWMIIGIVVAIFVYYSGYRTFAVLMGLLLFIIFALSVVFERKPAAERGSANVLEPIVIESTRGAPYRIPNILELQYEPDKSEGKMWEKSQKKWGKALGKIFKVGRGD